MKQFFKSETVELFCGDAREAQDLIAHADLILTDPPYGLSINRSASNTRKHAGRRNFDAVTGDDVTFDPRHLSTKRAILWGANCYAHLLPPEPGWIGWDKATRNGLKVRAAEVEFAWTNCVRKPRLFRYLWSGAYRAAGADRHEFVHPTQKPIALMEWCLSLVPDAQLVVDPYAGSGSTLIAAARMGRRAIGIEIDERYCELIVSRLMVHASLQTSLDIA